MNTSYVKYRKAKKFNASLFWLTVLTSMIYIIWRAFFTIPFTYGFVATVSGSLLVLAEAVGIFEAIQQFHGMKASYIPLKPIVDEDLYPDVDVFIATYNESVELLYKTINGCKHMEYPDATKVHIYLCDDGNRKEMKALASRMKIGYLTREEHIDAKAGNLNNALNNTTSPLIATFDADMIPLHNFLLETVPYFFLSAYQQQRDGTWIKKEEESEKIGFIQAPQSFYNADLFQYYLYSEGNVPNEQDFFYRDVQLARNNTNSAIYGGSNTVLSREALLAIGGFYTGVITEDFATGISIQAKGYHCFAIPDILAIGLAPSDLKSLIKQRERWARGCIQTLRKVNFLFKKGLHIGQKIAYLSSLLYWYTAYRRLLYVLSPILFAVFHIMVVDATLVELLLFWLPYYIFHRIALKVFSNDIRNDRWNNVYDTILFPSLLLPVLLETIGIRKRKFSVTAKESLENERRYQWWKAFPHIVLSGLSIYGIYQCVALSLETNSIYYFIIIFWLLINLYSLVMSVFFMLGRKMYRKSERFMVEVEAKLTFDGQDIIGKTTDISEGGFSFSLREAIYLEPNHCYQVSLWDQRHNAQMEANLTRVTQKDNDWIYGFQISNISEKEKEEYFQLLYDRVHTLPKSIEQHSSFFEDLSRNVMFRSVKKRVIAYQTPFMKLHTILKYKEQEVTLIAFNYDECILKEKVEERMYLSIADGIKLEIMYKQQQKDGYVYCVQNIQELKYNKHFLNVLKLWQWEYKEWQKLKRKELKTAQKIIPSDEFDEPHLYWEV